MSSYQFIVVGGGTSGSVLASRLSEREDARVLLLEAGPAEGPEAVSIPSAWPTLIGSEVDWGSRTVPQRGLGGAVIPYARGRMLGGSSCINAMVHLRAHRSSYDAWAADHAPGWGYDDLLPYFQRSEKTIGRDPHYRGTSGPMTPATVTKIHPAARACFEAFRQKGHPVSRDLNGVEQEGVEFTELTAVEGARQTAADAYLRPVLHRPNLTVISDAFVRSLKLSGHRCTGVEYSRGVETYGAEATDEVVVCAGAVGSPQLLQVSGIGPIDLLRARGVQVHLDLPGVGENLADHPVATVTYAAVRPMAPGVNNHGDVLAALRSDPSRLTPDIHIIFLDITHPPVPQDGFSLSFSALRPHSRGSVRIASSDPEVAPLIDPGFLTEERDVNTMLAALRMVRDIADAPALDEWRGEELLPGPSVRTDDDLRAYLHRTTGAYWHPVGTCRMGADPGAVTDLELRVRGIEGLRIADASVMPSIPAANTNATVLAIAERAASLLTRGNHLRTTGARPHREFADTPAVRGVAAESAAGSAAVPGSGTETAKTPFMHTG